MYPQELRPKYCFVRFFYHRAHLRDELGFGTRSADRTIIRGDGRHGSQYLFPDNLPSSVFGS